MGRAGSGELSRTDPAVIPHLSRSCPAEGAALGAGSEPFLTLPTRAVPPSLCFHGHRCMTLGGRAISKCFSPLPVNGKSGKIINPTYICIYIYKCIYICIKGRIGADLWAQTASPPSPAQSSSDLTNANAAPGSPCKMKLDLGGINDRKGAERSAPLLTGEMRPEKGGAKGAAGTRLQGEEEK